MSQLLYSCCCSTTSFTTKQTRARDPPRNWPGKDNAIIPCKQINHLGSNTLLSRLVCMGFSWLAAILHALLHTPLRILHSVTPLLFTLASACVRDVTWLLVSVQGLKYIPAVRYLPFPTLPFTTRIFLLFNARNSTSSVELKRGNWYIRL